MSDKVLTANEGASESQLHWAAWCGDLEEVTRLVEGGANVTIAERPLALPEAPWLDDQISNG